MGKDQARRAEDKTEQTRSKKEVKGPRGVGRHRQERQSSSERGWGAENSPEVQQALTASNSPYFSNSGSCSSLWFGGGTTCVLTSSEQKSSLHNSALREGGGRALARAHQLPHLLAAGLAPAASAAAPPARELSHKADHKPKLLSIVGSPLVSHTTGLL